MNQLLFQLRIALNTVKTGINSGSLVDNQAMI